VIEPTEIALFAVAAAALVAAPGPDMLLVLGRGVAQGRVAAFLAATGCAIGVLVLSPAVALGLAALVATSLAAFTLMKIAGALYLAWLGVKTLRGGTLFTPRPVRRASGLEVLGVSLAGNVVNPKVALFMVAFLPQFADPASPHFAAEIMLLGAIYAALTVVCYTLLGASAAALSATLERRPGIARGVNACAGIAFLLSAVRIATFEPPR